MDTREHTLALAMRASVLGRAMIDTCGRFLPYAARLDREGRLLCLDDCLDEEDRERIEHLWEALGTVGQRHGDRGGAVVYDAVVHDSSGNIAEAVVVELRRRTGPAARAFVPYERHNGYVIFGKPRLDPGSP